MGAGGGDGRSGGGVCGGERWGVSGWRGEISFPSPCCFS